MLKLDLPLPTDTTARTTTTTSRSLFRFPVQAHRIASICRYLRVVPDIEVEIEIEVKVTWLTSEVYGFRVRPSGWLPIVRCFG
jgi:hypothetical protein